MTDKQKSKPGKKLTAKQARFIDEYIIDLNGTQAAIRAKYSKKTAHRIAQQNLQKSAIIEAIRRKQEKIRAKLEVTAEKVITEFARIAFANPADTINLDGTVKKVAEMPEDIKAAISSYRTFKDGQQDIRFYDKTKALESLAKHLGLFEKDNQQRGTADLAARIEIMKDLFRIVGGEE